MSAVNATNAVPVPVSALRAHPGNVRKDVGDVSDLASSITSQGLLQPLLVAGPLKARDGASVYVVLDGHRRLAAARHAGLRTLLCVVTRQGTSDQTVATMLAAAMHKQLEPLEQAKAFKQLKDHGWSTLQIAKATGYSPGLVRDRLVLLELPAQGQQMVATGDLTLAAAKDLSRQVRRTGGGQVGRATPKETWFNRQHPRADAVANLCKPTHRETRVLIGGVGCGQCWQQALTNPHRRPEESDSP